MGKINRGRVFLGGIVAGIVIDVYEGVMRRVVLRKLQADIMTALRKSALVSVKEITAFALWGLVIGILTVWLYAAIRPRIGAGPKTAMCAGLFVWGLVFVFGLLPFVLNQIVPVNFAVVIFVGAEAVMMLVAGVVGAALYKEDSA